MSKDSSLVVAPLTLTGITLAAGVVLFAVGGVVGIWGLWQFSTTQLGDLGDFVGGTVGPLWSAASLLLLYAGYSAQRAQLDLQRREIHDASAEQQRSRIEGRFYELLRLLNAQIDNIDASRQSTKGEWLPLRGKRCIHGYYEGVRSEYKRASDHWKGMIGQDPQRFREILGQVERNHPGSIHGYYVSVDSLLKALDKATHVDATLGGDLSDVLVAQFANFELALLFLKFYSDARFANTLALARKHNLFRYFDEAAIWRDVESPDFKIAT